jgi:nucleoside-triphosphatase THEP1
MKNSRKILVMGLPGAGKTTLSEALAQRLNAVHLNADAIRANVNKDLRFSPEDRIEQARRMGFLADTVAKSGAYVVADFVCPTPETRTAFGDDATVVFVDRIRSGRFADTNALFQPPQDFDIRVDESGAPEFWAEAVANLVRPTFDWKRPTALFVGRYQPFHAGHAAPIEEGIRRVGQACIGVLDTADVDRDNRHGFADVEARISAALAKHNGRYTVVRLPNVAAAFHGGDAGYEVVRIDLAQPLQAISGTEARRLRERTLA